MVRRRFEEFGSDMSKLLEIRGKWGSIIGNYAIVDDDKLEELSSYKWYAKEDKRKTGIVYYVYRSKNRTSISLHRHLLGITDSKIQVDHINRNTLDYRIENLRPCTQSQNQANACRKSRTNNPSSKYKGVSRCHNGKNCYKANITNPNTNTREYLGRFTDEEKAGMAYDIKAIEYYGKFALLNFPEKDYTKITLPKRIIQQSNTGYKNIYLDRKKRFEVRKIIDGIEYVRLFNNIDKAKAFLEKLIKGSHHKAKSMKIKDLNGKIHQLNLKGYVIDNNDLRPRSEPHLKCREILKKLYPLDIILEEVHVSCENLYLDFFIPHRKLIIEVNGRQHTEFTPFFHKTKQNFVNSQKRDNRKKEWAILNGFKLVDLPDNEDEQAWLKRLI